MRRSFTEKGLNFIEDENFSGFYSLKDAKAYILSWEEKLFCALACADAVWYKNDF